MPSLLARIIAYLFVGFLYATGPVMLLIAGGTGLERVLFVHSSLPADGAIVGLSPVRPHRSSNKSYWPVFRFIARDGRSFTVISDIAERAAARRFGEHVRVLYQPDHPENARIDSFFQLWGAQLILGIVGGAFCVIPLLIFLRRRRRALLSSHV